jgi:DNA-binding MarR family transcriptional regulator
MNDAATPFTAQLVGQTEKTLNAVLDRQLAGRISEPEWVTMVLIAAGGEAASYGAITGRITQTQHVGAETAAAYIGQLEAKGLVEVTDGPDPAIGLSPSGSELLGAIRARTGEIIERLWGDLPATDLEVAGRVLLTVLERAEAELRTAP